MEFEGVNTVSSPLQTFCFSHRRYHLPQYGSRDCTSLSLIKLQGCLSLCGRDTARRSQLKRSYIYSPKSCSAGRLPSSSLWCSSNTPVRVFAFSFWNSAAGKFLYADNQTLICTVYNKLRNIHELIICWTALFQYPLKKKWWYEA